MTDNHRYLEEMRRQQAGGKVTVYRNRAWILEALDEGITKRAIYAKLVESEGLIIGYQAFAKHTQKLLAIRDGKKPTKRDPGPPNQSAAKADKSRNKNKQNTSVTEIKRYVHNPVPNLDELI
jgi:hypothetical protein